MEMGEADSGTTRPRLLLVACNLAEPESTLPHLTIEGGESSHLPLPNAKEEHLVCLANANNLTI